MTKAIKISAATACAAALGLTAFTYYGAFFTRKYLGEPEEPPKGKQYESAQDEIRKLFSGAKAMESVRVETRSRDGLKLSARYFDLGSPGYVNIFFHGYRSSALRDGCGMLKLMRNYGINTLAPDHRAHGKSEGLTITLGVKEQYDVVTWVDYVLENFGRDTKIVLSGCSMGAATVLMAADKLPENVVGIVADCGYTTPVDIARAVARSAKLPVRPALALAKASALIWGHFKLGGASAPKALAKSDKSILLIHGEADDFVPCAMSEVNYLACKDSAKLITVPGAAHAMSFVTDEEAYTNAVEDFLRELGFLS